jgi:hypothetical protein
MLPRCPDAMTADTISEDRDEGHQMYFNPLNWDWQPRVMLRQNSRDTA